MPQFFSSTDVDPNVRTVHKYGEWTISSRQRRLGEAYNHRRNIAAYPDDYTHRPLKDAILAIRSIVRDLGVPHVNYFTNKIDDICEIILSLHNCNYLDSTIVVVPSLVLDMINELSKRISNIDYSSDPNVNAKLNIFRRTTPIVSEIIDLSKNAISVCLYDEFCKQLMKDGIAFHNRAFVIMFDSTYVRQGVILQEAAKYISDQTVFVDSKFFHNSLDERAIIQTNVELTANNYVKGKQKQQYPDLAS
jgi:hypothetical protein